MTQNFFPANDSTVTTNAAMRGLRAHLLFAGMFGGVPYRGGMMDNVEKTFATALCLAFLAIWGKGCAEVSRIGCDDSWRKQIVAHGCAEYYLDEKHERQWRWKECAK